MNGVALAIVCVLSLSASGAVNGASIEHDESVIFFPTDAHLDSGGQEWVVPIHGWIFELEDDSSWRKHVIDALPRLLGIEPTESNRPIYEERGRMFLVDNERRKRIEIELEQHRFEIGPSEPNGHFRGTVLLAAAQQAERGVADWLTFRAILPAGDERKFEGRAHRIGPSGLSVISDIDDTIKISNVEDREELLANTFLRPFRAVPGMPELYRKWEQQGAVFHYLSASPWQLYPALLKFISDSDLPTGSFYLKNFRIKDGSFFNLFSAQEEYKRPIIERILKTYPSRRFVLVGDGGEEDPEIFAAVARAHREQIVRIYIRDASPSEAHGRYQAVFEGLPATRWRVFRDGKDLASAAPP